MSELATYSFWLSTAERAIKTTAQTAVTLLGTEAVDIISLDWEALGTISLGAGLVSVLTSLASITVGTRGTPSLV